MPSLRTARDATVGRAVVALATTKLLGKLPGRLRKRKRRITPARAALVGGVAAAVAGAVSRRRSTPATSQAPPPPPAPTGPGVPPDLASTGPDVGTEPSNYDTPGPPANTATPLASTPTDSLVGVGGESNGIDEESEIAAAAADAAAIGGPDPAYASSEPSLLADPAEIPLVESGEGEAEGQEQTEAELLDEVTDPYGPGAGQTDAEFQIEQAIEDQENPLVGDYPDVVPPGGEDAGPDEPPPPEPAEPPR